MDQKNYQLVYDEEKSLIDLIKLLVKNRVFILKVTSVVFILSMGLFFAYNKLRPLHMEQKFYLSYIDRMEEMQIGGVPMDPSLLFKDDKFIDLFFDKEFVKKEFKGESDKEKRYFILSKLGMKVEKLNKDKFLYTLTTKSKTLDENRLWADTYFQLANAYIEKQNRAKLDREYQVLDKKSMQYRDKLQEIENTIKVLVKEERKEDLGPVASPAEEIKEKNPRVFSEKDSYSELYNDVLSKKENLSQFLDLLDSNIEFRSSLVEAEGKVNLPIALIMALTGGFLIGIILVLGKNYFKNINWE